MNFKFFLLFQNRYNSLTININGELCKVNGEVKYEYLYYNNNNQNIFIY